ncbi:MAG: alpha/beta hydrolase [Polyangiales bacterium]
MPAVTNAVVVRERFEPAPEFGGSMYVFEAGPEEGTPLVLIHGLGADGSRDFAAILPALALQYRVFAFDLPGFGRSGRRDAAYTPARYVALLSALLKRHFGEQPVAVLGHSMGGALAIQLAGDHPEQVERLLVLDVAGVLHYREYMREVIAGSPQTAWTRTTSRLRRALFRIGMLPVKRRRLEDLALDANPTLRSYFSSARTAAILFVQHDFGPAMRRVRAPTFIGWGARDTVAPRRTSTLLRAQLPVREFQLFASSGHVPMRSEPEAVTQAVLRFLERPLLEPSEVERPGNVGRDGECVRRADRVFEGDYDRITIVGCKRVVLRNVRARELIVDRSDVRLEQVTLDSLGVAVTLRRARLRWTGGTIEGEVCIENDGSALDLGGVQCDYRRAPMRVLRPSRMLASASVLRRHKETPLHGEYELFRTQKGALPPLYARNTDSWERNSRAGEPAK